MQAPRSSEEGVSLFDGLYERRVTGELKPRPSAGNPKLGSAVIDPIQKFNEPLIIDRKEDFLILWIVLRKFLITTTESGADVYPNLTVDQFWVHDVRDHGSASLPSSVSIIHIYHNFRNYRSFLIDSLRRSAMRSGEPQEGPNKRCPSCSKVGRTCDPNGSHRNR
jgi:hypothetical protein